MLTKSPRELLLAGPAAKINGARCRAACAARSLFDYRHQRPPVVSRHVGFCCYRSTFRECILLTVRDSQISPRAQQGQEARRGKIYRNTLGYSKILSEPTLSRRREQLTSSPLLTPRTYQEREREKSERRLHSSRLPCLLRSSLSPPEPFPPPLSPPLSSGLWSSHPSPRSDSVPSGRLRPRRRLQDAGPRLSAAASSRSTLESPGTVDFARCDFVGRVSA